MNWIKKLFKKRDTALSKPDVISCVLTASCGCKIKEGKIYEMCGTAKYDKLNMDSCYQSGMQMIGNIQEKKLMEHLLGAIEQAKHCL
jgi:hypothetical protein